MKQLHIQLPEQVQTIIQTLQKNGHEAYAVGGCVRDSILGRIPGDWDITTSAMPEETKALFSRTFDTGIEHGTVTVLLDGEGFEVTTYRVDGEYEDHRHPKEVTFTRELKEDLLRRDFTINAMAYNDTDGLVDIFGGIQDIERGVIRCVGNAMERFSEDALRILRGVRFAAQIGFEIEEETKNGMRVLAPTLQNVSAERIQVELIKMLTSDRPELIRTAYELGITRQFLPEFDQMMETTQENRHHRYPVGEHTIQSMRAIPQDKVLRFAMLFHDIGKPFCKTMDEDGQAHFYGHPEKSQEMTRSIMKRLKFDNDTLHKVENLVGFHDLRIEETDRAVRRAMNKMGAEMFPLHLQVRKADVMAQGDYQKEEKLQNIVRLQAIYESVLEKNQCVVLKDLAISGKDLIAEGMKPGKQIGQMLNSLLLLVLEDPEMNTRETLLARSKSISLDE